MRPLSHQLTSAGRVKGHENLQISKVRMAVPDVPRPSGIERAAGGDIV